jgi:hypothetical protein
MLLMSSPFSFFRIVVFPALSSPLKVNQLADQFLGAFLDSQKEQTHLLLFLAILSNDCEKTHDVRLFTDATMIQPRFRG